MPERQSISRRDFLKGSAIVAGAFAFEHLYQQSPIPQIVRPSIFRRHYIPVPPNLPHELKLGVSFSGPAQREMRKSLGLPHEIEDVEVDFVEIRAMGFDIFRHSSRLDIDPQENEEYLKFQLEEAKDAENIVDIGDKQFPYPDRFPPRNLLHLNPLSKGYEKGCLEKIKESSQRLAEKAFFDYVHILQLSNEPFSSFPGNDFIPAQSKDFIEKIKEILEPLERKYLITDNLFDDNPQQSWRNVRSLDPDYFGINIYTQMGIRYYNPDEIIKEIDRRFPIENGQTTIPNGIVTEGQFLGWPISIPHFRTFGEEDLEKIGIFTSVDRDNVFYIAVQRFPRVFPWEVDKALLLSKVGKPQALEAIKFFLWLRDGWNDEFRKRTISSPAPGTSQLVLSR